MSQLSFIYLHDEDVWWETTTNTEFDREVLEAIDIPIAQAWFKENYGVYPRKEFIESLIDIPSSILVLE